MYEVVTSHNPWWSYLIK